MANVLVLQPVLNVEPTCVWRCRHTQRWLNFNAMLDRPRARQKYRRPVPPGGHDKSGPQSRRLSSRMLSDPGGGGGGATNLPKGHPSSSTLTPSLLTPYSLQSSPPRSQAVRIVHGEGLRSTFQPPVCFQQPALRPHASELRRRRRTDAGRAPRWMRN